MAGKKQQAPKPRKFKKFKMSPLPKAKAGQKIKQISFTNGSRLVRLIDEKALTEEWTFINASLSDLTYTISLEGSTNVKFASG